MISQTSARRRAEAFARQTLLPSGYALWEVPAQQVSVRDWAFAYVAVAPSGANGSPQIVVVDKASGSVRTLRQAVVQGWRDDS